MQTEMEIESSLGYQLTWEAAGAEMAVPGRHFGQGGVQSVIIVISTYVEYDPRGQILTLLAS